MRKEHEIERIFNSFIAEVYPAGTHPQQLAELRDAFFAGGFGVLSFMIKISDRDYDYMDGEMKNLYEFFLLYGKMRS